MSSKANQEHSPLSVQPGDVVELRPLGECEDIIPIVEHMKQFFGRTVTVHFVAATRSGIPYFEISEDVDWRRWFSQSWIARIVSRAGDQREAENPIVDPEQAAPVTESPIIHERLRDEFKRQGWLPPCKYDTDGDGDCHRCAGNPLGCYEKRQQYNPATHRLVPVEHYVGPEEFAELKRKAADYDLIQMQFTKLVKADADHAFDWGDIYFQIASRLESRPLTPTAGPPDLGPSVPETVLFTAWTDIGDDRPCYVAKVYSAEYLRKCGWASAIAYHVGPILPPQGKDGAE